ncbi:MAG: GGDEF domain-containing protein [Deltaproteobacteria bacterium]|nr:GGDEF domain-containing protein [Deltaproteobacteria bacterium]
MAKKQKTRRQTDRLAKVKQIARRRSLSWATPRLLQLGVELRQARALEPTLHAVTKVSVGLTRSLQGTLRLLDESGKRLLTSARTGPSVHRRGTPAFAWGEGFLGWVVVHRKPTFTNHPATDPRFVSRPGQIWTPGALMAVPLLANQACIGVLSVSRKLHSTYGKLDLDLLRLVAQLSEPYLEIARLKRLNESDSLTLLHNRRHLDERLPLEIQRAQRFGKPLALAMIDIDHFKQVNDTHGHEIGDESLTEFANRLSTVSRSSDVIVRWGGEEFVAIFPETNVRQGKRIAERMRRSVCDRPFATSAGKIYLTASIGLVSLTNKDDTQSLTRRVDQALYAAKRQGRNRVVSLGSRQSKK